MCLVRRAGDDRHATGTAFCAADACDGKVQAASACRLEDQGNIGRAFQVLRNSKAAKRKRQNEWSVAGRHLANAADVTVILLVGTVQNDGQIDFMIQSIKGNLKL